mmetsp:Transcript_89663/g.242163  ORF Transcript_89663/g.242163 Transcript_89663/m.242163 type:complete len:421 (-) Transcript_89663:163-1425(-)
MKIPSSNKCACCTCCVSLLVLLLNLVLAVVLRLTAAGGCEGLRVQDIGPVRGGFSEVNWSFVHWLGMRNLGRVLAWIPWNRRVLFGAPPAVGSLGPQIAFTFDDAIGNNATTFVSLLDFLDEEKVPATFFVIANNNTVAPDRQLILKDASDRGHELGNHGLLDDFMTTMSRDEFEAAVDQWESSVKNAIQGDWPVSPTQWKWFRPPKGMMSGAMDEVLTARDYHIALGDLYSDDWAYEDEAFHARIIKSGACDGSVTILHVMDGERTLRTLDILRDVIPALRARGFSFVRLSDLYNTAHEDMPSCAECPICMDAFVVSLMVSLLVLCFWVGKLAWCTQRRVKSTVVSSQARVVTNIRRRLSSGGPGIELSPTEPTDSALLAVSTQSGLPEGSTNDTKDCEDSPLSQRTGRSEHKVSAAEP